MDIFVKGIPSSAGALYSGTDAAPDALRNAGLVQALSSTGINVIDGGNVQLPQFLPKHSIPPIRHWPAPRITWEATMADAPEWFSSHDFTLILGGDCSIITGTALSLETVYQDKVFLLVIDGHFDALAPNPNRCVGAAAMGLWFLIHEDNGWMKPSRSMTSNICVIGCQALPEETYQVPILTLETVRASGVSESITKMLQSIPADAKILVHFDVDALHKEAMPAAYIPSEVGFSLEEMEVLLSVVLGDPRVIGMEVTEFSGLRDVNGDQAERLVSLLARSFAHAKKI